MADGTARPRGSRKEAVGATKDMDGILKRSTLKKIVTESSIHMDESLAIEKRWERIKSNLEQVKQELADLDRSNKSPEIARKLAAELHCLSEEFKLVGEVLDMKQNKGLHKNESRYRSL